MEDSESKLPMRFQILAIMDMGYTILHTIIVLVFYYMYAQLWIIERMCFQLDLLLDDAIQSRIELYPHVPPWQLPPVHLRIPSKCCRMCWVYTMRVIFHLHDLHQCYSECAIVSFPSFGLRLVGCTPEPSGPTFDYNIN